MFFLSLLTKEICINSNELDTNIKKLLEIKTNDLVGKIMGNKGIVISIIDINQLSKIKIDNETGKGIIKINYKAVVFKLMENEIIDARPFFINEYGFFCKVGVYQIFTSKHMMTNWEYNSEKNIWKNGDKVIAIDESIRLKITLIRINSDEITAMANILQ